MISIRKNLLNALVLSSLAGMSQATNACNAHSASHDKKVSGENPLHIMEVSTLPPSVKGKVEQNIIDKQPRHTLDVYLDWHKHWKLIQINRSDS